MIIQQLPTIILIVENNIIPYLPDIFDVVYTYWEKNLSSLLTLVEHIFTVAKSEFTLYVPKLITLMLKALNSDKSIDREPTMEILDTFQYLAPSLSEFSHIVMPSILKMMEVNQSSASTTLALQKKTITTINLLCQFTKNTDYLTRIINPLLRTLEQSTDAGIRNEILEIFCSLIYILSDQFIMYIPIINDILKVLRINNIKYFQLVNNVYIYII